MFYFILIVLLSVMVVLGTRANELHLIVTQSAIRSDSQTAVWHEMGGTNILLMEFGPGTSLSFLAGLGVIIAYIGLWLCAVISLGFLVMVVSGAALCALVQFTMVSKVKKYFAIYERENGENPQKYFTGKNGLPNAVYTSVMIGIGKAVKLVLICSVVGILLYVFLRSGIRKMIDVEAMAITGDYAFPPNVIYDERENPWTCTDVIGENRNIRVYSPAVGGKKSDMFSSLYVDVSDAMDHPNATHLRAGNREFHW